jgi:hypothetical protein
MLDNSRARGSKIASENEENLVLKPMLFIVTKNCFCVIYVILSSSNVKGD